MTAIAESADLFLALREVILSPKYAELRSDFYAAFKHMSAAPWTVEHRVGLEGALNDAFRLSPYPMGPRARLEEKYDMEQVSSELLAVCPAVAQNKISQHLFMAKKKDKKPVFIVVEALQTYIARTPEYIPQPW